MGEQLDSSKLASEPAKEVGSPRAAGQRVVPEPAGSPAEGVASPATGTPELGWLLKSGSSSIGLFIRVMANANELTSEVIQGLERLMAAVHGTARHDDIICGPKYKQCPHFDCGPYQGPLPE